jgi:hypothetical protein
MKPFIFLATCTILLVASACNNHTEQKAGNDTTNTTLVAKGSTPSTALPNIPKDATEGDFNGDGVKEYVWLVPPTLDSSGTDCVGDCNSILQFSNPSIPPITVEKCIDGIPVNHGDLNEDKSDEIGLLPQWFTSCWSGYHVYTLKAGKWIHAVPDFSTHCNQWEAEVVPIEKDAAHPGHVIIRYSEMTEDSIALKEKSIPIK